MEPEKMRDQRSRGRTVLRRQGILFDTFPTTTITPSASPLNSRSRTCDWDHGIASMPSMSAVTIGGTKGADQTSTGSILMDMKKTEHDLWQQRFLPELELLQEQKLTQCLQQQLLRTQILVAKKQIEKFSGR